MFVACGGDGTIQCLANELNSTDKIIGILPIGSGNDFAKVFGTQLSKLDFLDILVDGTPRKYDLVLVNKDACFINTYGIGFDAVANEIASRINIPIGKFKYFYAALCSLINLSAFELSLIVDGKSLQKYTSYMAVITNGRWEGGSFFISPDSSPVDGVIELTIITSTKKYALLKQIIRLILNLKLDSKDIKRLSFKSAVILLNNAQIAHSDGEVIHPKSRFEFKVKSESINILSPIN